MLFLPFNLVLASASPRRKELLARLHPDFEVCIPSVDESALAVEDPKQTARRLAWEKASAVFRIRSDAIVLGADTIVAFEERPGAWRILGKPRDETEAAKMLRALSGRRHAVITAVALIGPGGSNEFDDTAWVTLRPLSEEEILAYVATGEPLDKAGAYAIQGRAAGFVEKLEGYESTVVGLPVEILRHELETLEFGFDP